MFKWGLACVCIPRESYYWLEDWVEHYVKLGACKIAIYDNTGSVAGSENRRKSVYFGGRFQKEKISKRGEKYGELTAHILDEQIEINLNYLQDKYSGIVEIVKWTPLNDKGEIVHCQVEAYADFCRRYRNYLNYVTFFDMDEYMWFASGHSMQKLLKQMNEEDIQYVSLKQRRFKQRWGEDGPNDIKKFTEYVDGKSAGLKWLAKMEKLVGVNLHYGCSFSHGIKTRSLSPLHVAFNHYNVKEWSDKDEIKIDETPYKFLNTPEDDSKIEYNNYIDYALDVEWGMESIKI